MAKRPLDAVRMGGGGILGSALNAWAVDVLRLRSVIAVYRAGVP